MRINVKNSPELVIPTAATPKSSGYDVVAISDPEIVGEQYPDGGWKRIDYIQYSTGIYAAPQTDNYGNDYHILLFPRSSISKYNLMLANSIGLVDNDYRGQILFRFKYIWQPEDLTWNQPYSGSSVSGMIGKVNTNKIYKKGDKMGQLVSDVTNHQEYMVVDDLTETIRGAGGFGSSTNNFTITDGSVSESTQSFIPVTNRSIGIQPQEKKVVEKAYESKVDILEKWKQSGGSQGTPTNYETLIREREKNL